MKESFKSLEKLAFFLATAPLPRVAAPLVDGWGTSSSPDSAPLPPGEKLTETSTCCLKSFAIAIISSLISPTFFWAAALSARSCVSSASSFVISFL